MRFEWWEALDTGFKTLFGLFAIVATFLGGGKLIRINRADSATTDANVASVKAEEAAANSVASEVARLSALVKEQGQKIDLMSQQIQELKEELGRVHNGRTTALKLLRKIDLCAKCDAQFAVLLETAITSLEDEDDAPHEHKPDGSR